VSRYDYGTVPALAAGPPTSEATVTDHAGRLTLRCPGGHVVVSAMGSTRTGAALAAGDFDGESCGNRACGWTPEVSP
jgi:hypothetical protein